MSDQMQPVLIRARRVCGGLDAACLQGPDSFVARVLDDDELIGHWTLVGDELEQLSGRRGATKLGFALLLRFYAVHGRFPMGRGEIPDQAVAYVARLVPASELGPYEWDGRTIKAHRADIRKFFGFRECSVPDAEKAAEWLAINVCEKEAPGRPRAAGTAGAFEGGGPAGRAWPGRG
ncbi:DUF4158 domain-containing protein [Actinoallomurus purpureus]|uniref:DUF4158 domain-containing protein n=1 Tax=Actinoallomurus purpureus TaxID=478114 RepID=UPI00209355B0|nr:DUF4158 domain-containing protein [Actinoallomurus purpureus]MCO6004035.1 DUF4158 domain-containing protein [Actinoallomurus purpureus]